MRQRKREPNRYYQGGETDHFDGERFFNPGGLPARGFRDLLRWQLGGRRAAWPRSWPSPFPQARPEPVIEGDRLRVTMVGHSTLLIQTAGLNILTDPVWSRRVSPFRHIGPARVNEPGIRFNDLPPIDLVLLSHNHYDHMDVVTLAQLAERHDPLVVTPLGNDAIIRRAAPALRVEARDWGESVGLPDRVSVHVAPARHWSARGTRDRLMALWGAFAVETPGCRFYYAGDTGFGDGGHFRAAAERYGPFRLAILPIGAYEPRWFMQPQHQDPAEAVEAFRLLRADFAAGCHWGTFRLTNEAIDAPRDMLMRALDQAGIARERFRPMLPGEVWNVPRAA